jgi:hypothetical protein
MAGELKCRECKTPLSGAAYLTMAARLAGGRSLCVTCADQHMAKFHVHTLHDFVPAYTKANRDESQVAVLRAEIQELRGLLDALTKP